jgi:hypothetical protein
LKLAAPCERGADAAADHFPLPGPADRMARHSRDTAPHAGTQRNLFPQTWKKFSDNQALSLKA